jgi:hypothetical protein
MGGDWVVKAEDALQRKCSEGLRRRHRDWHY